VKGFVILLREGIIFQGALVIMVGAAVCYLAVTGHTIPEVLTAGFGMIVGYFFAHTGQVTTVNGMEKYLHSLGLANSKE